MSHSPAARILSYPEISVGMREKHDYLISPEIYRGFLLAFADYSPIHVDEAYARECGFVGPVMHGALLNGFLSHFIGMHFPGGLSMLLSSDLRFCLPSYLGDQIQIEAVVGHKLDARNVVVLDMTFTNLTQCGIAARGRVQVMIRDTP